MLFEDKLLRFLSEIDEPVLINVAGQAGSGRSEFLRELGKKCAEDGTPSVFIDASNYENSADPFLVVFSQLFKEFERIGLISNKKSKVDLFKRAGVYLAKRAVPVAARIGTAGLLSGEEFGGLDKVVDSELSKVAGKLAEEGMGQIEERALAEQGFKDLLSENLTKMRNQSQSAHDKIIVLIDEIDKLLPERGLAFLDVLNGAMRVEGLAFVLSFDRSVLDAFGDKVYGNLPIGLKMSDRMIDMHIPLPNLNVDATAEKFITRNKVFASDEKSRENVKQVFATCSQVWSAGVAEQNRLMRQLKTILGFMDEEDQRKYGRAITAFLFLMRYEQNFYSSFIKEKMDAELIFEMICRVFGSVDIWSPPGVSVNAQSVDSFMFRNDEVAAIFVAMQLDLNPALRLVVDDIEANNHRQYRYLDGYDPRHLKNMANWSKKYLKEFELDDLEYSSGYTVRSHLDQKIRLN